MRFHLYPTFLSCLLCSQGHFGNSRGLRPFECAVEETEVISWGYFMPVSPPPPQLYNRLKVMTGYMCIYQNDHHEKVSYHLRHLT